MGLEVSSAEGVRVTDALAGAKNSAWEGADVTTEGTGVGFSSFSFVNPNTVSPTPSKRLGAALGWKDPRSTLASSDTAMLGLKLASLGAPVTSASPETWSCGCDAMA